MNFSDWRINWTMPAPPLGPALGTPRPLEPKPAPPTAPDIRHMRVNDWIGVDMPKLPEGINDTATPGEYEAQCCRCERWGPLYCDISEVPQVGYEHYCGGSPHCCP